jgi:chitin elicitor receptor kinase 1
VRLIGYCIGNSLSLVYEFVDNGNLSQHLRGTGNESLLISTIAAYSVASYKLISMHDFAGREPLSWSARVQIALDSARGLEYIHEHTVPVYIHRDIKSANILIDKNYRAKVGIIHELFFFF